MTDAADPQSALEAAGLHFAYDSAVNWVTPAQLAVLTEELEAMSMDATSMDITSYYVTDCLLRAQAGQQPRDVRAQETAGYRADHGALLKE